MNISVGKDDTDHIAFFCQACKQPMRVSRLLTQLKGKNKNTMVMLKCECRKEEQWLKFYWRDVAYPDSYEKAPPL